MEFNYRNSNNYPSVVSITFFSACTVYVIRSRLDQTRRWNYIGFCEILIIISPANEDRVNSSRVPRSRDISYFTFYQLASLDEQLLRLCVYTESLKNCTLFPGDARVIFKRAIQSKSWRDGMNEYFVKYTYFIFGRWRGIFFGIRNRKRSLFGSSKIGDWRWFNGIRSRVWSKNQRETGTMSSSNREFEQVEDFGEDVKGIKKWKTRLKFVKRAKD